MDRVFDNGSESRRQSSTHNRQLVPMKVAVHEPIQPLAPQVTAHGSRWLTPLLTGVMQSPGGRSSAIFQINNASIAAEIGESLGINGWTLAFDGTSSAVIRNNGQEHTLSVGGVC